MRALLLVPLFFIACLDETSAPPPAPLTCEQEVCEYVSECSPLTTGGWDWRNQGACMDTFECGERPGACWKAVMNLPCMPKNPRWDQIEKHTRAMVYVRDNCQ